MTVESAINAEMGGANRLELCACLGEGGTTPTLGMLRIVKKSTKLPVFVMIRPRGGDFLYSENENEFQSKKLLESLKKVVLMDLCLEF